MKIRLKAKLKIVKQTLQRVSHIAILCVTTALFSLPLSATPILPTDLTNGDIYHVVFVTSTLHLPTSGAITFYDGRVQAAADASSMGLNSAYGETLTWKAIASTGTVDAINNANIGGAVYRLDGVRVASSAADMWDGTLLNPINLTEEMLAPIATAACTFSPGCKPDAPWTGSNPDGTKDASGFFLGNPGNFAFREADANLTSVSWITDITDFNNRHHSLYGISQPLVFQATTVPEPSTLALLAIGLVGIGFRRRQCR